VSGAHENASFVSCVHLRNMSHVSLGCLSLLLHTCVDKALVPVNRCVCLPAALPAPRWVLTPCLHSGLIALPTPSPVLDSKSPAMIDTTRACTSTRTRLP
jgi:hypothetical protein